MKDIMQALIGAKKKLEATESPSRRLKDGVGKLGHAISILMQSDELQEALAVSEEAAAPDTTVVVSEPTV